MMGTSQGSDGWQERTALFALSLPPVSVMPESAGMGSTLLRRVLLSCAVLRLHLESTSAAAPETCGVAMEVPLRYSYALLSVVDSTSTPGAPKWTEVAP